MRVILRGNEEVDRALNERDHEKKQREVCEGKLEVLEGDLKLERERVKCLKTGRDLNPATGRCEGAVVFPTLPVDGV